MNSSGRSWTVRGGGRGGNKARRCCWSRWRRERERGIRERRAGGVAVLLNFNEYQGEFLLGFLPCSLYVLFSLAYTVDHTALNLCHTNELERGLTLAFLQFVTEWSCQPGTEQRPKSPN